MVGDLRIGQLVSVSGCVWTGRDRLHKFVFDGGKPPVNFAQGAIYHCGPVVLKRERGWVVKAAGPTTSIRHEAYMPRIIELYRPRVIIGKGGMGDATRQACRRYGCVYLQAVGGAASLIAKCVEEVSGVYMLGEFGPAEAMWEFKVRNLVAIVTIDTRGRSLHGNVRNSSRRALMDLL
jgi:fumarate hydratase class I